MQVRTKLGHIVELDVDAGEFALLNALSLHAPRTLVNVRFFDVEIMVPLKVLDFDEAALRLLKKQFRPSAHS